jgi:CubicO group peptidase (beta-lactamase class C family)
MRRVVLVAAVVIVPGCSNGGAHPNRSAAAIERVTAGLLPAVSVANSAAVKYSLADRMAHYHIPAVSIAVVDSGKIVWARAFGVKEAGTTDSATATTLFQAASISKPIGATAMLRLVEDGKLNLDANVNDYLKSWKVPDNKFTTQHKVTLRRIASHSAGLTIHGFPGYSAGDPLPTVPEVLDGKKPANTGPVRVDTAPGSLFRYSGGGTTLMQLVVMDVTGEPFATTVKRLVLDPIGMSSSTYEQPLPEARRGEAAAGHKADGTMVPGRWHTYPEQGAAGLWTTPTDLLKWAISIASSRDPSGSGVLSRDMAQQMLTVQQQPVGLGPFLDGTGKGFHFGHGGSNEGFRCELIYFPATRQGAAVMTNGDLGSPLTNEVLFAIAAEYGWVDYGPKVVTQLAMDSTVLDRYAGTYVTKGMPFEIVLVLDRVGTKLFGEAKGVDPRSEVVFTEPNKVISVGSGNALTFLPGPDGAIDALEIGGLKLYRKVGKS